MTRGLGTSLGVALTGLALGGAGVATRARSPTNGQSKAAFAVAHTLLVSIWHMLARRVDHAELGPDHFDRRLDLAAHTHRLVRQLELLSHRVTLEPAT